MRAAGFIATLLIAFQQFSGCDATPKSAVPEKEVRLPPAHRFVNVTSPNSPGIALDTVTGQYCKTWDWSYKVATMNGGLDTVPTCLAIFRSTPAGGDPKDPLGILEQDKAP
jgi:hypothetical protein